ncbi:Uncharacterised protein [Acinetobacter baumannii]|nr:Uncharacterised protein [Acinetobacter baumannii]
MRTVPRLCGRRSQTDAVNAGKACSGSPKRSSESGWTWYSRLAEGCCGSERAKAPSWLGAIDNGPLRLAR